MKDRVTLKIPRELYDNLKELIEDTGFSSVNSFVIYTMRTIVSSGRFTGEKDSLTDSEIKNVRERLKTLGYID